MKIKRNRADKLFSDYIRARDNWTCQRCGKKYPERSGGLHCSHYWSRRHWSTRHDPENCDAICFSCHLKWGGDYRNEYTAFKKKQLGEKNYKLLDIKAHTYAKKDEKMALIIVKELLKSN